MLIKIKAKFVRGDKVGPLILRRLYHKSGNEDFLVVQWFRLCASCAGARVQPLAGKLSCHRLGATNKKKKIKKFLKKWALSIVPIKSALVFTLTIIRCPLY